MKSILKMIVDIFSEVLDIFYPRSCLGCKINGEILCLSCITKITKQDRETDNVIAPFSYQDPLMKKIIWNFKYYHHKYLGIRMGEILYDELLEDIADMSIYTQGSPILVVPVPISKLRRKERGYNQAELIAKGMSDKGGKNLFILEKNIVFKNIETIPQARITNKARRLKNIKNTFSIKNKNRIKEQTIIIIDDVTTTGGTINEILNLLKRNGAKKVIGFALAH